MWLHQSSASLSLGSWNGKAQPRISVRRTRGIRPIVTLLEERTLLSQLSLTVNTLADDPSGSIPGYTTLRDAITQANASTASQEVISFAVNGTIDLTSALPDLNNNIFLEGPRSANLTVQRASNTTNTFSVLAVASGVRVHFSCMTISGGNSVYGGGVKNSGTLEVTDCIFSGNTATDTAGGGDGGGIYNDGVLTVSNSTFINNIVSASGGGIYSEGMLTVSNCTFTNNTSASFGAGICSLGPDVLLMVSGSSFTGNSGVGICYVGSFGGGTLTVDNSTFTNNFGSGIKSSNTPTAVNNSAFENNSDSFGGGINIDSSHIYYDMTTVTNSTFTGNCATTDGGGIYNVFGMITVVNSTFTGNSATTNGGGIYNLFGLMAVCNSTFNGNSATTNGGGISNYSSMLTLTNSTITNNYGVYGGGINTVNDSSLTLNNTIVAGNTGTNGNDIYGNVQATSEHNLIGTGSGIFNLAELAPDNLLGTTTSPLNPKLGPLADNGGPTQTMALLPGSPAIDAGGNGQAADPEGNALTIDQRGVGFPRIIGQSVDIGATEFSLLLSQTITFGPLGDLTYGSAPFTLSATASSNLPVSYTVISGPATVSGNVLTIIGAGKLEVEAKQAGNSTYNAAAPVDESFTVAQAALTITPTAGQFMNYGGAVPELTFTYVGLVNHDSSAMFNGSLATTASSSSNVDVYPIGLGTLAATGNYTITTFNPGTLTVNAAPLNVYAVSKPMTYGGTVPELTLTYSGLVNSDSSATFSGGLATAASPSSGVGVYPITQGTLAATGNYTIGTFNPGTLAVNAAPLTVTVNSAIKIYGVPLPLLGVSYSGFVNGDSPANLMGPLTLTTTATAACPVLPGGYAIIASGASDPNYAITYQPGTLLVAPSPLTIAANNTSMVQGNAVPPLSVNYNGFVNGDSPANLTTQPTVTTPATPFNPGGAYPIVANGASSPNYAINYVSGVLVVTPAPVRVLSVSFQAVRLGKIKKTTQVIVLQFSGSLNAGSAQNIGTYSLVTIPATKKQKSKPVPLSQAIYNPANNTVRLVTRKPLVLNPPLKLTINATGLLDSLNRPLDGDLDGWPGGTFVATLHK